MKEFIEKLITRIMLESASCKVYKLINPNKQDIAEFNAYKKCIEIVKELAGEYKDKDCSECSRRKFYQQGYEDAKKEYINTSTDTSSDTSTTNAEWKQHILNRFEGGSV